MKKNNNIKRFDAANSAPRGDDAVRGRIHTTTGGPYSNRRARRPGHT